MSALDELAEAAGIQARSIDAFGKEHATTPDLKRALLQVMGFAAEDDTVAAESLRKLRDREWTRTLPPVQVAYQNGEPTFVRFTCASSCHEALWTLELESGEQLAGRLDLTAAAPLEERVVNGQTRVRRLLELSAGLPAGYHRLELKTGPGHSGAAMPLIITPGRCWLPDPECRARYWGVAANLPLLRSEGNWGAGDLSDLTRLVEICRLHGADCVGLNPLHALFLDAPENASPYSPSDRLLLNVLNIDVQALPGFATCEAAQQLIAAPHFQQRLAGSRAAAYVDYKTVAELKLAVLRLLFAHFERHPDPVAVDAFARFHDERRALLDRACLFQALRAHFASRTPALPDCREWPTEYTAWNSPAVQEFARTHAELVRFHLWLQWAADAQLAQAAAAADQMAIGLYRDLAVGADPAGAEVWSYPESLVSGATVGAPPDILNGAGQNWGLPPLHPIAAYENGYSSFIDLLRANMRYAGALRIDHAMALRRLYWIPNGNHPKDGAYVHYAMEDLIGILALESQRNRCMIVGEDLGTVPEGFRERMASANILSYRVLSFERTETSFLPPDEYPYLGLSVASNHDLATLRGWWQEEDITLRERLGLYPEGAAPLREERARDRQNLTGALHKEGLLRTSSPAVDDYCEAAHRFLARTGCMLTLIQLDDLTGEAEQVNLPGTTGEHPNWRRRLSQSLEELAGSARLHETAQALHSVRSEVPAPQRPSLVA